MLAEIKRLWKSPHFWRGFWDGFTLGPIVRAIRATLTRRGKP